MEKKASNLGAVRISREIFQYEGLPNLSPRLSTRTIASNCDIQVGAVGKKHQRIGYGMRALKFYKILFMKLMHDSIVFTYTTRNIGMLNEKLILNPNLIMAIHLTSVRLILPEVGNEDVRGAGVRGSGGSVFFRNLGCRECTKILLAKNSMQTNIKQSNFHRYGRRRALLSLLSVNGMEALILRATRRRKQLHIFFVLIPFLLATLIVIICVLNQ